MPKRSRKPQKKSKDENETAFDTLQQLIARTETPDGKDPLAVLLGRRGGLKGGKARAERMTPEQRKKSASKAAQARWGKTRAR
jgi:hypothetical protein